MVDLDQVTDDLRAEHEDLDAVVADLPEQDFDLDTPAEGWTIRDQLAHLAFFDEQAVLAVTDPPSFAEGLTALAADPQAFMDAPLRRARGMRAGEVLSWWRSARAESLRGFASLDPSARIPWYGPPMSPASFVSARLMETWAHGQDVVDGLGRDRPATARLRHIAHLGVRARDFSYRIRGLEPPAAPVEVSLVAPDGGRWEWNPGQRDRVAGPAHDFCLVVTQRRHPADTSLETEGPIAAEWMRIAQVFAGPPGKGRRPGQFA
ncbi:MAG TPA: TIGR03084 family metal-binding protein [Actinomycetota bacterium]|jgi:uncharacterized protein (TIGR03084 family)|nr:TIGR03084 family metal-binding protein [Actinomycetota bacterium]